VDTAVRKSWQIDPEQFELRSTECQSRIKAVVQKVTNDLDVACGPEHVVPQLYKLLLYEEGAFFLPHQDSEKVDHMFGTLAVCLPSEHSGGDLFLSHNGENRIFASSESSELDYSYAAWYADVSHEVKPVTSGNRLVLIYNLVQTNSTMHTSASIITSLDGRLKAILSEWNLACNTVHEGFPRFLIYKLSHEYTKAALSFDFLKGSDNITVRQLINATEDEDFTFYLAHVEKEVLGSCDESEYYGSGWYGGYESDSEDVESEEENPTKTRSSSSASIGEYHKIVEVINNSLKLTRVVEQDGQEVADDVEIDIDDIAQGNIFKRAPNDEDYSGYTGNEGVSTTHFYHDSVVVLIPRRSVVDFKLRSLRKTQYQVLEWIRNLQAQFKHASHQSSREHLDRLCNLIIQHNRHIRIEEEYKINHQFSLRTPFQDSIISQTAHAALQLDDVMLFEEAMAEVKDGPSQVLFEAVQTSISRLGFETLIPGTTTAVQRLKHISEKWSALLRVGGSSFSESAEARNKAEQRLKGWITVQVHAFFNSVSNLDANDGTALAEIAEKFGFQMLTKHVAPFVTDRVDATPFALAFIVRLFELRGSCRLSDATIDRVYGQVLTAALESFHLNVLPERNWPRHLPYTKSYQARRLDGEGEQAPAVSGERIVQILKQCATLLLEDHIAMLLEKIHDSAMTAPTTVFRKIVIPYLSSLLTYLKAADSLSIMGHDCGLHVCRILRLYINRYVEEGPHRASTWARPTTFITCSCKDCGDLKAFIQDEKRKEGRFSVGEKRRRHLQAHLYSQEGYTSDTIRQGSPHTLVIRKTHAQYRREHVEWKSRYDTAKENMSDLARNPCLKKLLGDRYDEIMDLKVTDQSALRTNPSTPLGSRENPSAGAQKQDSKKRKSDLADPTHGAENKKPRKKEVVDLTSE